MSSDARLVTVGRVGRAHGRDGSFWVEDALRSAAGEDRPDALAEGVEIVVAGERRRVERRAGTDAQPLVRLSGVDSRKGATALRGERILVDEALAPLATGEWLVDDLVGTLVEGVGRVRRVLAAPSCDLLEVGEDGLLVPLVADAIREVDLEAGRIQVDQAFLGVGETSGSIGPDGPTPESAARP